MKDDKELTEEEQKDLDKRMMIAMTIFFIVVMSLLVAFMFICYKSITANDLESSRRLLIESCIFAIVTLSAGKWLAPVCIKISGLDKYDIGVDDKKK